MLVNVALGELSMQEVRDIAHGMQLHAVPNYNQRFKPIYRQQTERLTALATADAQQPQAGGVQAPGIQKITQRKVRECITKWTVRLLRDGHLHDQPPHQPGYRIQANMETLTAIRALLLAGWTDSIGQQCLYRSLHDLQNRKPEFVALRQKLGLKTLRGVWSQLTTAFPAMRKMAVRVKKVRDGKPVQVSS